MANAVSANQAAAASQPDPHSVPQYQVTHAQLTLFVIYIIILLVWTLHFLLSLIGIELFSERPHRSRTQAGDSGGDVEAGTNKKAEGPHIHSSALQKLEGTQVTLDGGSLQNGDLGGGKDGAMGDNKILLAGKAELKPAETDTAKPKSKYPPPVTVDRFMTSVVIFGAIMFYFYISDYLKLFPQEERNYSRDQFLFLVFLFFLVASAFTVKPNEDKILNRDQTEEWKGWMQVMFVWYHYFKAKEWYNWIRVYIAAYVWMTGFGNFSFFWVRSDFSIWRMVKMLFRLNFLVLFVAVVTNNDYMLYYICAMHTYWFLTVYVFMRVLQSWNRNRRLMAVKFAAYAFFNAIIFDIPGVSQVVFRPLYFVLGLNDNSGDIMHEWSFRAGLDHWACFVGMLSAYNYPHFERLINYLDARSADSAEALRKLLIRLGMTAACLLVGCLWFFSFMGLEKYTYNKSHPYTSAIPVLCFIILRNIHPVLRSYHIGMFAWLGKITLETYLSQLHIYLLANARTLLTFLNGYPLLNFALVTIIYLFISHRLFIITNDCSNFLLPPDRDVRRTMRNIIGLVLIIAISVPCAWMARVI